MAKVNPHLKWLETLLGPDGLKGRSEAQVKEKGRRLVEDINRRFIMLGCVLEHIARHDWGFAEYCDEIGLKYRKAMYLRRIFRRVVSENLPIDKVSSLGWTKMRVLCPVVTNENFEMFYRLAINTTVADLEMIVENGVPRKAFGYRTMTFRVSPEEHAEIVDILDVIMPGAINPRAGVRAAALLRLVRWCRNRWFEDDQKSV